MKKIILGITISSIVFFIFQFITQKEKDKASIKHHTSLLQKEINNVGKLIVTEGNFSQVFTYNDSKKIYFDIFSSEKKAIVIINAKVTVAYDLSKINTQIIPDSKKVVIANIPDSEITINPDIEYYDMQQDYLNRFTATDFNTIKTRVNEAINLEIQKSNLIKNAQNRLLSELQKLFILTRSMGWTLVYNNQTIANEEDLKTATQLDK